MLVQRHFLIPRVRVPVQYTYIYIYIFGPRVLIKSQPFLILGIYYTISVPGHIALDLKDVGLVEGRSTVVQARVLPKFCV